MPSENLIDRDTDIAISQTLIYVAISQLTKAQSGGPLSLLPSLCQLFLCWIEPHDFTMVLQLRDVHTNTNLGEKEKKTLAISIPHFWINLLQF